METPTRTPYQRYALTLVDHRMIAEKAGKAQVMKNVPGPLKNVARVKLAFDILVKTKELAEKANSLRKEQGFQFLDEDTDFMNAWKEIEAAANSNKATETIRLALAENIKLTHEINSHLRRLGRPLLKTYK